jgi:hypothetical protein
VITTVESASDTMRSRNMTRRIANKKNTDWFKLVATPVFGSLGFNKHQILKSTVAISLPFEHKRYRGLTN